MQNENWRDLSKFWKVEHVIGDFWKSLKRGIKRKQRQSKE
jgi:hypothetical protein